MSQWINIPSTILNLKSFIVILNRKLSLILSNTLDKNAINGTFTTADGKTITVVNGQVTSIV